MANSDNDPEINRQLIEILDEIIDAGPWDAGPLFKVAAKRLTTLRDRFKKELVLTDEEAHVPAEGLKKQYQPEDLLEVFVALYCAGGTQVRRWEDVLSALSSHNLSRPIYQREADIKSVLRSKPQRQNDAYARVLVRKQDLIAPMNGKEFKDRSGYPLLLLKLGAIHPNNILRFVHVSGEYNYKDNRLYRVGDTDLTG